MTGWEAVAVISAWALTTISACYIILRSFLRRLARQQHDLLDDEIERQRDQQEFLLRETDLLVEERQKLRALLDDSRRETARLVRIAQSLASQDWFFTADWQAGETEADADIEAGRVTVFGSADAFLEFLDENSTHGAALRSDS